jgi:hypothetical protein
MKTIKTTNMVTGEVTEERTNENLMIGEKFRLIGRTTIFKAVEVKTYCGMLVVGGVSLCGKFRTGTRVCDTVAA